MSYGKVHDVFWDDDKIEALSDRAALLALFLVSGPHRNAIGCFKLGMGAITDNPRFGGWGIEGVSNALQELIDGRFIFRDERTGWTFIRNALKHDPIKGFKAAIHAAKLAGAVPTNTNVYKELHQRLTPQIEAAREGKTIDGYPLRDPTIDNRTPIDTPSKGVRSPSPSPSPSPLPSPEPEPSVAPPALDDEFDAFWGIYPKKADRGHALKAFRSVRKRGVALDALLAGAKRYRDDPQRKPEFTKNGATWLNGECWGDEGAQPPPRQTSGVIPLDF